MLTEGPSLLFVRSSARIVRSRTGLAGPIIISAWNLCDVITQAIWRERATYTLPRVSIDLNFMFLTQATSRIGELLFITLCPQSDTLNG